MSKSKTRLYFGKLHETTRERDLEKFVRGYGKIREISVKRGYGFVEFQDGRDAEDVVYELNGRDLLGERVIIEHAREPSRRDWGYNSHGSRNYGRPTRDYHSRRSVPVRTEHRLAVENLSSRINWQELKEFFNKAGDVTFTDAHKRKTGIGIVEFATNDDMKKALKKLDGVELNGKKLKLAIETVRSRSRSRSRGRRLHSRSPKRHRHHSRSRSPRRSHSQSPSKTGEEKQESKSRSRSKSEEGKSRSPSHEKEGDESNQESGHESSNGASPAQRNGEEDENGNEAEDVE